MVDMMKEKRLYVKTLLRILWIGPLFLFVAACASSMAVVPVDKTSLFTSPPADAVMLNEGASWLGAPEKPADYAKAKEVFASLLKTYPKSKWRPLTETFIRLIDKIQSLQAGHMAEQALSDKISQEREQMKKEIQELSGRFQSERTALLQENEKLKKDIEMLKQLEVQLDRREKMLR